MALYTHAMDLGLAMPRAAHTLTPGALEAVESMRRAGHERRRERVVAALVTDHGHTRIAPHSGKPPAALARVEALALAHGWKVKRYESITGHALQGRKDDLGFRAIWQHGKTRGATWHERTARWSLVRDERPPGVNKLTRTSLKGKRPAGVGEIRLALLGAPWGLPLNVTALEDRLNDRGLTYEKGEWR